MPLSRLGAIVIAACPLALTGCGYVHFGRTPPAATAVGDHRIAAENADLRTEQKILRQELALARKEGDTLRAALEQRATGTASPQFITRLNETTRELAALRTSYAELQAERERTLRNPASAAASGSLEEMRLKLAETEERLASTLRTFTALQDETQRLRREVEQVRAENVTLVAQVTELKTENLEAQAALSQLNTELLAQKESRARAEQSAQALRAQLHTVVAARTTGDGATSLSATRETAAGDARALSASDSRAPAQSSTRREPDGSLEVSPERLKSAASTAATPRKHVVGEGDTLETIARRYYNDPAKWYLIYGANSDLLQGDRPLQPGMEIQIPER